MKRTLLSLALLAATLGGVATPLLAKDVAPPAAAAYQVPDPANQIRNWARLFRAGDVAALAQAAIPPSTWEEIRVAYDLHRLEPSSEHERAEFAEKLARLAAPHAVDELMAEVEPKLEEARAKAPGALLMAFGAMQIAVNSPESELTEAQRAMLRAALPGIQGWAAGTDFLSSTTLRQALDLLAQGVQRTGISTLDQVKALPLEAVLDRAAPVLASAKQAVRLYGIDLDAVADSLQVEVLEIQGETARVRTTVTLFGAPLWHEHDLVLVEGRWYGKQAAFHLRHGHDHDHDQERAES